MKLNYVVAVAAAGLLLFLGAVDAALVRSPPTKEQAVESREQVEAAFQEARRKMAASLSGLKNKIATLEHDIGKVEGKTQLLTWLTEAFQLSTSQAKQYEFVSEPHLRFQAQQRIDDLKTEYNFKALLFGIIERSQMLHQ